MIPVEAFAAPVAAVALAAAFWSNRRAIGWLPDDPPRGGRKNHARRVPLAGVVLVAVAVPWLAWLQAYWLAAAAALAGGIGYLDDRGKEHGRDLDWRWKALALAAASGCGATAAVDPFAAPASWALGTVLIFVLVNATNFLDNMDGVAASLSCASLFALAGGDTATAMLGFAALGFLPWNWPHAFLFLGDAGAYLLGVGVGTACLRRGLADPCAVAAVAVQLADFAQVVVARLALGLPPWVGDRRHLTHVLHNLGVPRPWVAPLLTAAALLAFAAC
jgi:UDP-N-acetylmuramyl pentapeptide phosphotransferase/UDP-N-acetylglucosamine-1-phosphate transferase